MSPRSPKNRGNWLYSQSQIRSRLLLLPSCSFHWVLPSGPYGKDGDYTRIALATRECGGTGWVAGKTNSSNCATKYKIDASEATKYFDETTISNENVDEYANTINQVSKNQLSNLLRTLSYCFITTLQVRRTIWFFVIFMFISYANSS